MDQQRALGIASDRDLLHGREILLRLLFRPPRAALRDRRQVHRRGADVTGDAARVARPLLEEDRLDVLLEVLVVEGGRDRLLPCLAEAGGEEGGGRGEFGDEDGYEQQPQNYRGCNRVRHANTPIGANVPFSTACVWS